MVLDRSGNGALREHTVLSLRRTNRQGWALAIEAIHARGCGPAFHTGNY